MSLTTGQILEHEFKALHPNAHWHVLTPDEMAAVKQASPDYASPPYQTVRENNQAEDELNEAQLRAQYYLSVHGLEKAGGQTALCLSGGGIRSAAFCMGVLQGLARLELLGQFDYLSTVSGGGYIGSWLAAWSRRAAVDPSDTFAKVEEQLAARPPFSLTETAPFHWLRRNQRFLTPSTGLGSADTWAAIALIIRNLLLNWTVYLPLLAGALLVPRLLEYGLIAWAYEAVRPGWGGSCFGYLFSIIYRLSHPQADLPDPPGVLGSADLVGALLVLGAMVVSSSARISINTGTMSDLRFRITVLLPLVCGAGFLILFVTPILVTGGEPDGILQLEWMLGTALTYALARVVPALLPTRRTSGKPPTKDKCPTEQQPARTSFLRFALLSVEVVAMALSGAAVGLLIWCMLWLRWRYVPMATVGVRDLVCFGIPLLLLSYVIGQIVYAGLTSLTPNTRRDQEWFARASGQYLFFAAIWAIGSVFVLFSPEIELKVAIPLAAITGSITLGTAISTVTQAKATLALVKERASVTILVQAACLLFIASGVVLLAHASAWLVGLVVQTLLLENGPHWANLYSRMAFLGQFDLNETALAVLSAWPHQLGEFGSEVPAEMLADVLALLVVLALLLAFSAVMSVLINVNQFSLHALYRNRLVRTFLGASNVASVTSVRPNRSRFSGFAPGDDIDMANLRPDQNQASTERFGPLPVINMALNLTSTHDLAWQERKAAPFIATPFHVGGDLVRYQLHSAIPRARSLKLGTAMAISGAAVSPNWGYHSSPLVGFVMMLFNVRLGWWLRNPARDPAKYEGWRTSQLVLQELFSRTSETDASVYLSDGGHFDNLGLYEMLRRRCRTIVVVDATADKDITLEDLGRSLRQTAIDLGITVEFGPLGMVKRSEPIPPGVYCAMASIRYPEAGPKPPGQLIYLKPGFYADTPADVRAYAAANSAFPHDTTLNQWFTESQFESYRRLGSHVIARIFGWDSPKRRIADMPGLVAKYLGTTGTRVTSVSTRRADIKTAWPPPSPRSRSSSPSAPRWRRDRTGPGAGSGPP